MTLDEFILLHEVLSVAAQANPQAVGQLRDVQNAIGQNVLGNLLELGKVAFAPASPAVNAFSEHMIKSHGTFLLSPGSYLPFD